MKTWMRTLVTVALVAVGAASQLSCSVNDYCLNCFDGDGGMGDGGGSGSDGGDIDAEVDAGCVPSGGEICDGKDNDCNGLTDDGVLPEVGDLCANQNGACAGGVKQCTSGALKCSKTGSPEVCDSIDNNCDGQEDEGDPGGGAKCGTDLGECIAGQFHCNATTGTVECFGFIDHTGDPELCDAKDNDCDGTFDENVVITPSACGPTTNNGECNIGSLTCQGGSPVCMNAVFPKFETCNNLDDDCDLNTDEIFSKTTDPLNCGACGNVCATPSKTCINGTNNGATCTTSANCTGGGTCVTNSQPRCQPVGSPPVGSCTFTCNVGFHNDNGMANDGCEYRCFATGAEECDGADNDCDGNIDEGVTAPAGLCLSGGECGATAPTAMCTGASGWTCTYPGTVQFPETLCDGKNNDCDANIDEAQPNKGGTCFEVPETACTGAADDDNDGAVNDGCAQVGAAAETAADCTDNVDDDTDGTVNDGCPAVAERGVCKSQGTYQCSTTNPNGPAACVITMPGQTPSSEACDAKDNDCDGGVDEGGTSGNLVGQDWVSIGGGKQIMKYEASKPDATATAVGTTNTIACSRAGVQPWTNVRYQDALAACQSIGASLCGEPTWHRACSVVTGNIYPLDVSGAGTLIEAEDYSAIAYGALDNNPETAGNCSNAADDDADTFVNDGCPAVGAAETGSACGNATDDDGDGARNDGCPARGATRSWVPDYTSVSMTNTFSSVSALEATPNLGTAITTANAPTQSPRVDYAINFTTASSTYHVWVRMFSNSATDSQVHVGINVAPPAQPTNSVSTSSNGTWQWRDAGVFDVPATGLRTVSIYMGHDGTKIDQIYIVNGSGSPPSTLTSKGNKWAYASNPDTYNANTCNGNDYDTDMNVMNGDQDDILVGGTVLTSCYANHTAGAVFDLSGNVKEWTLAHAPGENPVRGGASNNTADGISCPLNFTLADDSFFFPNIGFRCCRAMP